MNAWVRPQFQSVYLYVRARGRYSQYSVYISLEPHQALRCFTPADLAYAENKVATPTV